jgi:hypothetical protein
MNGVGDRFGGRNTKGTPVGGDAFIGTNARVKHVREKEKKEGRNQDMLPWTAG